MAIIGSCPAKQTLILRPPATASLPAVPSITGALISQSGGLVGIACAPSATKRRGGGRRAGGGGGGVPAAPSPAPRFRPERRGTSARPTPSVRGRRFAARPALSIL